MLREPTRSEAEHRSERLAGGRRRWAVRVLLSGIALAAVMGAWMAYNGITSSWQAENNLHATLFAIRLVEQFVATEGTWPRSWDELEGTPVADEPPKPLSGKTSHVRIGGQRRYQWPAQSPEIQKRVFIDFGADPRRIANEDSMHFSAIRPIGPYYEYRRYGFVESLQAAIRASMTGGQTAKQNDLRGHKTGPARCAGRSVIPMADSGVPL